MDPHDYEGREQALVKHLILKNYLQKLAFKIGQFQHGTTLNYIDGFSGPWDAVTDDASDSSPHIAARELHNAQYALAQRRAELTARAMFVEQDKQAFNRLEDLRKKLTIQTEAHRGMFEDHIDQAIAFARTGKNPFAFVFIDPTGWTGYALDRITRLLRVSPGEVLINFMTKDVLRFIDDPPENAEASFIALFGGDYRKQWRRLEGLDREDAIVRAYCARVKTAGAFRHVVSAVVLNPRADRTHYHLVYGTRSNEGLVAFRETEASAVKVQRNVRAKVRADARNERSGFVGDLFEPTVTDTNYVGDLLDRYHDAARQQLQSLLEGRPVTSYDEAVLGALQWPMTAEQTPASGS